MLCAAALLATGWAEALPLAVQVLAALAALPLAAGAAWHLLRRPVRVLELRPRCMSLHEQWPVTVVRLHADAATFVFWPDTLCDSGRRILRRWAGATPEASPLTQFWTG